MTNNGAQGAQGAAWSDAQAPETPTVGWFVRRSAQWMCIMIVALVLACGLYALASQVGANASHASKAPPPEFKI